MPFQIPVEKVKVAYFYELETHLGMPDIESKLILRYSFGLPLSKFEIKNLGSLNARWQTKKDFKVGDDLFA